MPDDPTGYRDALATIPENQLSTRQQQIATGLAMIRDGSSCLAASKATGIPNSTLWGYHKHLSELGSKDTDGMARSVDALQQQALVAARIATERVTERLVDPEHPWKDGDLIKAQGVNIDKVIAFQNRYKPDGESAVNVLSAMLEEGDITITKRDEASRAIDVTGTGEVE